MPYISTEEVRAKRKEMRAALPEWKLSVRKDHHSGIRISVMEGPLGYPEGHIQLNPYYLGRNFEDSPEWVGVLETIKRIAAAGMSGGHHDSDYGYVPGHYVEIEIGKWDKDYVCRGGE
jgi:hypothetical protein